MKPLDHLAELDVRAHRRILIWCEMMQSHVTIKGEMHSVRTRITIMRTDITT